MYFIYNVYKKCLGAVESGERAANEILYLLFKENNSIKCDYEKTYYYHREKNKFNSTFIVK